MYANITLISIIYVQYMYSNITLMSMHEYKVRQELVCIYGDGHCNSDLYVYGDGHCNSDL